MQDLARVHAAQDDSVRRGEHHSKLGVRVGIRLRQNIRSCRDEGAPFGEEVAQNRSVCAQLPCRGDPVVSGNNRRYELE